MIELTRLSDQQTSIWESIHNAPVFKNANEFSFYIEKLAAEKEMTHMEAVLDFCKNHMIEPSDVVSIINKSLKEKIAQDARELNYLPKVAQLEF